MIPFCRLCLISVEDDSAFLNITENEDLLTKIQALLPNVVLSLTDNPEICKDCYEGVQYVYTFCQNVIYHYNTWLTQKELYNEKTEFICKLCLEMCNEIDLVPLLGSIKIPFQSIMMVLKTAVPQLNLELSEGSFMCNICWDSARTVCNFKKKWIEAEDRLQNYSVNAEKDKLTEVDMKNVLSQATSDQNLKINCAINSCNETKVLPGELKIKKEDVENYIYQDVNSEYDVVPKVERNECDIKYEDTEEDIANDSDINVDEDLKVDIAKLEKDSSKKSGRDNKSKKNRSHSKISKIHECQHCSYKSDHKQNFQRHLLTHGIGNKPQPKMNMYTCDQCFYQHYRKDRFNDHMRTHAAKNDIASVKDKLFKCEHCSFTSLKKENIKQHFKQKHDTTPPSIKCKLCPYVGKLKAHLASHMVTHMKEYKFVCHLCGYKSKRKTSLKFHMINHERSVGKFHCDHCTFKTSRIDILKGHVNSVHLGEDGPEIKTETS